MCERMSQSPFAVDLVGASAYLRVYTQVLSTGQTEAIESALLRSLLFCFSDRQSILHEALQLGEGLLNLGDRS